MPTDPARQPRLNFVSGYGPATVKQVKTRACLGKGQCLYFHFRFLYNL